MRAILLLATIAACGGNLRPPDPSPPAMQGDWRGTASVVMEGDSPMTYEATVSVAVNGPMASVRSLCSTGDTEFSMYGFDDRVVFRGEQECRPNFLSSTCFVVFTFTEAEASLSDGELTVTGTGTVEASGVQENCQGTRPFTFSFAGAKD